jgi:hypothetical protein
VDKDDEEEMEDVAPPATVKLEVLVYDDEAATAAALEHSRADE